MSDNITKARQFLASFLHRNNTHLAEHSAVQALAEYADQPAGEDQSAKINELEETILLAMDKYNRDEAKIEELEAKVASQTTELEAAKKEIEALKKPAVTPTPKATTPAQPVSGSNQ